LSILIPFATASATTGTGGGISFAGYFNGTTSFANTLSYIKGGKENSTADNYAAYLAFGTRINGGSPTERMRITSGGNIEATGSIKTGTTTTGNASAFKLGARIANTCTVSTTAYLEIELGGTLYYLAFANPS